jgi:hypothetical protein
LECPLASLLLAASLGLIQKAAFKLRRLWAKRRIKLILCWSDSDSYGKKKPENV